MTVGDSKVIIMASSGGFVMSGGTATILAAPGQTNVGGALTLDATITPDGLFASYTTTGTDFTTPGFWQLQLRWTYNGMVFSSPPEQIYVFPLLGS